MTRSFPRLALGIALAVASWLTMAVIVRQET